MSLTDSIDNKPLLFPHTVRGLCPQNPGRGSATPNFLERVMIPPPVNSEQ